MNRHLQCITCHPLLQPCIISINQFVDLLSSPLPTTCVAGVTTIHHTFCESNHVSSAAIAEVANLCHSKSERVFLQFVSISIPMIFCRSLSWFLRPKESFWNRPSPRSVMLYALPTISYDLWIIRFCRSRCYLSAHTLKDNAKRKTKSKYNIKSQWITEFCPFYDFLQISHSTRVSPGAYTLIFCLLFVFCSYVSSVDLVLSAKDPAGHRVYVLFWPCVLTMSSRWKCQFI